MIKPNNKTSADSESIIINVSGIFVWYILWTYFDLFKRIQIKSFSYFVFYTLIGVLLFNIQHSRNGPLQYNDEIKKIKDVETNSRTICGYITTIFLCSRLLDQLNLSKNVHKTFYILLSLSSISLILNLFELSLPQKPRTVRILRKIESVTLNFATAFTVLMIVFVSLNIV